MTIDDVLEWIILITAVIASIIFLLWVISDFIVAYRNFEQCDKVIRLTYKEFISNYNLNPDRYTLNTGYLNMVSYQLKKPSSLIYIYFSSTDIIKIYRLKRKLKKSNKMGRQKEAYQEYIETVKADKEKAKRRN